MLVNGAPVYSTKQFWSSIQHQKENLWNAMANTAKKNHRDLISSKDLKSWQDKHKEEITGPNPNPIVVYYFETVLKCEC